ncbi:ParA family protein [Rubrivirga sp. IMCC45206]|uniref:ParA family protein n=1 Tax=Rubrivirga sp. IMCC45206 TaxID=3391614 RepID=UPI00398F9A6E
MPVVTVCNHKGGTGKTTTSIHLAAAFGRQGRRVLVVDFDPQGFLTRMLGVAEPPPEHSALGLLAADADLRAFPVQTVSGFDLVGSSMALTKALRRLTKPTDVLWLRETVRAGHDYDVVLLDTAAALSPYTMNALVASDQVVIPVTPEYQPVVGAEQTWQTSGLVKDKLNPALKTPRFLLTQVDARLSRHARYATYLREKYRDAVLSTAIRTSSSLAVASRDGRTVFDAPRPTRGAVDYTAAAEELGGIVFGGAPAPQVAPSSGPESVPAEASAPARSAPTAAPLTPAPPAPAPVARALPPIHRAPLPGDPPRPDAGAGWTPLDRL